MKSLKNILIVLFSLLVVSCQHEVKQIGTYSNDTATYNKYSVYTYCNSGLINFSENRSIVSGALNLSDLDFYLYGKNIVSGEDISFFSGDSYSNFIKVNPKGLNGDENCGIFTVSLGNSSYNLFLVALPAGKEYNRTTQNSSILFIGNTTVDLRRTNIIRFYLSGNPFMGNSSFLSTAHLAVYTEDWGYADYNSDDGRSNFACKIGIYKRDMQNTIVSETDEFIIPKYYSSPAAGQSAVPTNINLFPRTFYAQITPGIYNFTVCIYDKNSSRKYYYSDTIMMYANQEIEKIIKIPNIMETVPEAPSDFRIGYIEPDFVTDGKYLVDLEWNDCSYSEEYFQLELIDVTDTPNGNLSSEYEEIIKTVIGKSSYTSQDYAWSYLKSLYGSICVSNDYFERLGLVEDGQVYGTLSRNSPYVCFAIPLGSRYLMRLCAVNSAGSSNYVYPDMFGNFSFYYKDNVKSWVWDTENESNSNFYINLYRISYFMNYGKFYNDQMMSENPPVYQDVTSDVGLYPCFYGSQKLAGVTLFDPTNIHYGASSFTASFGSYVDPLFYDWKEWRNGSTFGDAVVSKSGLSSYRYKDYKNLYLYAYTGAEEECEALTVYDTQSGGVPLNDVCILAGNSTSGQVRKVSSSDYSLSVSKTAFDTVSILVKDDFYSVCVEYNVLGGKLRNMGNFIRKNYADWSYTINDVEYQTSVTHLCWELPIDNLLTGTYYIYVHASKNSVQWPCECCIKLEIVN